MVTADEIERVPYCRAEPREPGAARAHVRGHQPRSGRVRGARGRRSRALRPARRAHRGRQARRRHPARRRRARPRRPHRRGADHAGDGLPVGSVRRSRPVYAHRAARLPLDRARSRGCQGRRALAGNRMSGPGGLSGHRRGATAAAGDRRRRALGRSVRRPAALPRSEPDHLHLAPARCGRRDRAVGRPVAPAEDQPTIPRRRRQDRRAASAPPNRGAAELDTEPDLAGTTR
jgi:hypothetical protein